MSTEAAKRHKYPVGYYVVCVIDILGQQERLAEWAELPPAEKFRTKALPAIKKTAGTVLALKEQFEDYFERVNVSQFASEEWAMLSLEQKENYKRARMYELSMQQFGDTFVFYSPLATFNGDKTTLPLWSMMQASCFVMLTCLAAKVPLRGGICIGPGIELESRLFYGPALARAHHLESKVAEYPRIVVSREVIEYTQRNGGFSEDGMINKVMMSVASRCLRSIKEDTDGSMKLDFLGLSFQNFVRSMVAQVSWHDVFDQAYNFVQGELNRFDQRGDAKMISRYRRLLNYMQHNTPRWQSVSE